MKKFITILQTTALFDNFAEEELLVTLKCLAVKATSFQKEQAVLLAGSNLQHIGIVLSGRLRLQREDAQGNIVTIDELGVGDVFGEAFVCAGIKEIPVNIWSMEKSQVMFLNYAKIIKICSPTCNFHSKLIKNMLKIMSLKLISLNKKMDILQKKTIREKIMAYLESFKVQKGDYFAIPFNRNELAEYIRINRSAMSRELCKMKSDGVIDFKGNKFCLK